MPISLSSISQVLRAGVMPKKKAKPKEDLSPTASFKRKYGILSKSGKKKKPGDRVDSDWGFPLPPSGPSARRYARAVLSRAHQAKDYDPADVARQVKKAKAILAKSKTAESGRSSNVRALREYGINADGSWEQQSQLIQKAASTAACFGAVNGERQWSISIIASYPAKSAVIVGNTTTGELWAATYAIDANDMVTFPTVKKAKQTFSLAEAQRVAAGAGKPTTLRAIREAGGRDHLTLAKPKKKIAESIKMFARVREVKIDADGGVTAECIMLAEGPGNGVDGHYYTGNLIDRVAENGVFEGAQSYADHADDIEERARGGVRSVRDLLGWWSDVHVEEAGGKKLLIGTFNVESGNEFALNKMREAKRYAERYKDDPSKQYIGFSIIGSGESERAEIGGKPYNVVLDITEAGSTDMVSRAGAGGRLLTLSEADMSTSLASKRGEKKLLESLIDGIAKKLGPGLARATSATPLTEAQLTRALKESGVELDDDAKGKMHAALSKALSKGSVKKSDDDDDDDDESEDDEMEDGSTGDPTLDDILEPDEGDEDDEMGEEEDTDTNADGDENIGGEGKKKKESARVQALERELREMKLANKARSLRETARSLVAEAKVPAAMRRDVLTFLVEQCRSEKAMRAYLGTLKPLIAEGGITGNVARTRESGARGNGLLTVSGVEKAG